MLEYDRANSLELNTLLEPLFGRRFVADKEFMQLASEGFVVLAFASDRLLVRTQFVGEIAQGGLGQRTVLALLVPVVRPKCEKNADADEDDFQNKVEQGLLVFPTAQAHRALSFAIRGRVFKQGANGKQPWQLGVVKLSVAWLKLEPRGETHRRRTTHYGQRIFF
jgi:hypothetical protein